MKFDEEIKVLIRAGYPLLCVETWEEERCTNMLKHAAAEENRKFYEWTTSMGLIDVEDNIVFPPLKDPGKVSSYIAGLLSHLLNQKEDDVIFALKDFHHYMKAPLVLRLLRDITGVFKSAGNTLIMPAPAWDIPVDLEKDANLLEFRLPELDELEKIFDDFTADIKNNNPNVAINLDDEGKEKFLKAMLGLTQTEVENTLAKIVVRTKSLDENDIPSILEEKEQIIRKSGILEFYSSVDKFRDIGGLDELKEWLKIRVEGFSERARKMYLPPPKGILLVGVPGCGKSLCAKAVASEWGKPLLKFDMGKIYGSYLGESESNLRKAIQVAESVSPSILWIDEIEKAPAGSSGGGDSGTSQRIFGTLLNWMEEKTSPVFVVATANRIAGLPPELIRKGRIDEIFFVDLPYASERKEIFRVHLQKRNKDPQDFQLEKMVETTEGFSGAEIEQTIISALFDAFSSKMELNTDMIVQASEKTVPLSKSMKTTIERLRKWAREHCRFASSQEIPVSEPAAYQTGIDIKGKAARRLGRKLTLNDRKKKDDDGNDG